MAAVTCVVARATFFEKSDLNQKFNFLKKSSGKMAEAKLCNSTLMVLIESLPVSRPLFCFFQCTHREKAIFLLMRM